MSDKPIKVLVVEPMEPCRVQETTGLRDMQSIVGGQIGRASCRERVCQYV